MKKQTTFYVHADNVTVFTCKTKSTAVKKARQLLDTLLYNDVTISKLTIG